MPKHTIPNLFFILTLFPYLSFIPVENDVQPIIFIVGIILFINTVVQSIKYKRGFRLRVDELVLLSIGIISALLIGPASSNYIVSKRLAPIASFIIYYCYNRYTSYFKKHILINSIFLYVLFALLNIFTPNLYLNLVSPFMYDAKVFEIDYSGGSRGVSSLCTEPSFLGVTALFFLLISLRFKLNKKEKIFTYTSCIFLIISSFSVSGILYCLIVFCFYMEAKTVFSKQSRIKKISYIMATPSIVILFFYFKGIFPGRAGEVLKSISLQDLLLDSSIGMRVINIWISIIIFFKNPLGVGGDGYSDLALSIYYKYELSRYFKIAGNKVSAVNSSLSLYLVEIGVLFLVLFFLFLVKTKITPQYLTYRFLGFILLLTSFSYAFPAIWLLFSYSRIYNKRENPSKKDNTKLYSHTA